MTVCDLSVRIMSPLSLSINVAVVLEVQIMIRTITMMCLMAGAALAGRSGDLSPKPGERTHAIEEHACYVWERAQGGSIPPAPRHS
jgi:hypothetical protein